MPIQFTWDIAEGLPLMVKDNSSYYIYGPGGEIVEQIDANNNAYYYHPDQLGSIRALTNSSGTVADSYAYDAYGNTTASSGTVSNQFRYAGEYQDVESNLYYLRARYYDPSTQQFLTVDSLVAWTGQAYAYVGGSPLNGMDPSGLDKNCGLFPNPFDPTSCISEGWNAPGPFNTPAGPWVVGGGAFIAVACVAGGCEALGIGAAAAPALPVLENDLNEAAPAAESGAGAAANGFEPLDTALGPAAETCSEEGVTILGKLRDTAQYAGKAGYNVLEDALAARGEEYWWGANKAWLDRAIARESEFMLVSDLNLRNILAPSFSNFLRWGPLSAYGRELAYLILRGQTWTKGP